MILIVKTQIGETGPVVTVRGRDAWALLEFKAANDRQNGWNVRLTGQHTKSFLDKRPCPLRAEKFPDDG